MVDLPEPESPVKKIVTPCLRAWRKAAAQFVHDFRIGEPARNVAAFVQTLAQFGAGNVQDLVARLDFIVGHVAVFIFEVHHHVERNHGDADVGFVLLEDFLRLVRAVEGLAVGVLARTGMIAAHDEVGAAMVLADQTRARWLRAVRPCAWPAAAARASEFPADTSSSATGSSARACSSPRRRAWSFRPRDESADWLRPAWPRGR